MTPFATSLEHVLAELERIDLLLRVEVWRARQIHQADEEFQGLCISEQEVDEHLAQPVGMPRWAVEPGPIGRGEVRAALDEMGRAIAERREESLRQGVQLRLHVLRQLFGLSDFELDVLLIGLAPEIDLRYGRIFGYLQDDVTKTRPSVDLVLNLLCPTLAAKLASRARFHDGTPLLRHRLLERFEDPSQPRPTLLAHYLKVDPRIAAYLFGDDRLDPRLETLAWPVEPSARLEDLVLPGDLASRLEALAGAEGVVDPGWILYLQGPHGVGRETVAEALCQGFGRGLLVVDLERLPQSDHAAFTELVELADREAALWGAAVCWRGFETLLTDERKLDRTLFLEHLDRRRGLAFLTGESDWEPADTLHARGFLRIEFPRPDARQRTALWSRTLEPDDEIDPVALASRFRFTAGQIRDAAATAESLARRHAPQNGRPTTEHLYAACRLQSNPRLAQLAQKLTPRYRWDDIVLPPDRFEQLREIASSVKYRSRVYDDWGFDRKLSMGKGLNVLFAGPSGTGKTMAAEILARELGLDVYKIDLSTVVSKYIGETEKNLSRIFTEAATSNAILFFDEADALFGKRSEVRDSHDRYANVEISYLLQKMEEYDGMVILATNLRKNMDNAFVRRLHFTVEFPLPDETSRRRIWQGIWPRETPRSSEVDLDFMARRFEIAGGNIRNIALAAAFLAAEDGGQVDTPHLMRAMRREYQKMGKVVAEGEFGTSAGHATQRSW